MNGPPKTNEAGSQNVSSRPSPPPNPSRKRRLLYFSTVWVCLFVVLVVIELATRLFLPHISSLKLFVVTPQQTAQVSSEKQSAIFEGDALLLWRLKPNLNKVVWDFTILSTNAQHFRSDYPVSKKDPGVFRIVCLGDSVTFGYRVPPVWPEKPSDYDPAWLPYPALLEKQLRAANPSRRIEVITMAVPGYSSHQGLAWLRRDIDWLQPDLLTVSFGWNDVSLSNASDRETMPSQWYVVGVRWLIDHSQAFAHATSWLRSRQPRPQYSNAYFPRVSEQEYLDNLWSITTLASQRGARTVLIAAPYRDQVTNPSEALLMTRYRNSLRNLATNNGIPFLEVRELTESAYPVNEGWFGELIHPNHMGHRLLASELLKLFAKDQLLNGLVVPQLTP